MSHGQASPGRLTLGEQRALASFIAGRLPAGQLHDALARAREAALADTPEHQASAVGAPPMPESPAPAVPALHPA
jgi:hypothetical protein